jgi:tRNA(fMet)-specific endonuclease VapC
VGRDLILDSGPVIHLSRGNLAFSELGAASDRVAIAAITVAEFRAGTLGNPDMRRAQADLAWLDWFVDKVDVLDYTAETAIVHAELIDHTASLGQPRGAHDLIIAAHAFESGRTLITTDRKARFGDLPGVTVIER